MAGVTDVAPPATTDVKVAQARELHEQLAAAWNSHKVERVLSMMTAEVIYDDASWPTQMRGHDDVRAFLQSTWRAVPDLSFKHDDDVMVDESGTKSARHWSATATHTGPWDPPGLGPTGRHIAFDGATLLETRDGKICRIQVIYDVTGIMRQAGVLPKPGNVIERLLLAGPNLLNWIRRR